MIAAGAHHAPALALIHAASFAAGQRWDAEALAVQLALPGVFGLVAEAGGFVLARATVDEAEILTLAVIPELRRRGLARRLMEAAQQAARDRGAIAIFLEVATTNVAAAGMYAAMGYRRVGLRRRYYVDGADAAVLRRDL